MKEILTIFMDYCGSGIYPFLFLLSLVYLFVTEKDRKYVWCFWKRRR